MSKKKVQTTNLISIEGKKPRIANDYNKMAKKKNEASTSIVSLALLQKL